MLLIISDLHLSDGSTANNVHQTAFTDILFPEIISNGHKNEAKEIRIVLLGDIFDLVRTDHWTTIDKNERPWNGTLDPLTALNTHPKVQGHYEFVLQSILDQPCSKGLFSGINSLRAEFPGHYIKVSYVIGNHDRALNNFPSLQELIKAKITGVNVVEFLEVVDAPEYGVLARHGHEWDGNNHGYDFFTKVLQPDTKVNRFSSECYNVQTIGEVVTAELMGGLITELRKNAPGMTGLIEQIKDVNNIRPMGDSFLWLEWIARNTLSDNEKALVLKAVTTSVGNVLDTDLAKLWDKIKRGVPILYGDLVDDLGDVLKLLKWSSFDSLKNEAKIYRFFEKIFSGSDDDLVDGAKEEWENGRPAGTQYIVYGHTHEARRDYFQGSTDSTVRLYINTGTYLPLIQKTREPGFSSAHQMTMTFFYRVDEDTTGKKGTLPTVDIWEGTKRKIYS